MGSRLAQLEVPDTAGSKNSKAAPNANWEPGPIGFCGSGWNERLVPDLWPFGGFDMATPCKNHDECYSKCNARKAQCDWDFLRDMEDVCSSLPSGSIVKRHSVAVAFRYYGAVDSFGQGAFDAGQRSYGGCK